MVRAPCCEKVGLKKGRWTAEEDEILTKYIQANGEGSWRSLPKNAGLLRCGKSCRLRWINYLRADLKRGNISAEEEDVIVKLHSSYGNRWSLIASHMPGRTDNEIKNYWNSHLSRKIYSFRRAESTDTTPPEIIKVPIPPKPKGGRTSRWAMKKNRSHTLKYKQRPKLNATQNNNEPSVPLPPTPSLESEGFSSVLADFMALDHNVTDMVESAQLSHEPKSSNDETHKEEGPVSLLCCGGVNEGLEQELQCPYEKESDGIVRPYQVEGINGGGGALSFSDMMDGNLLEACGVLSLTIISEERESNDVVGGGEDNERGVACPEQMVTDEDPESSMNLSSNGESGERYKYSCSPMELGLDDNWDWESLMELNDRDNNKNKNNNESDAWRHKENLLTWLWEDDDWDSDSNKLGVIDPEKQDDMVAWLLSS